MDKEQTKSNTWVSRFEFKIKTYCTCPAESLLPIITFWSPAASWFVSTWWKVCQCRLWILRLFLHFLLLFTFFSVSVKKSIDGHPVQMKEQRTKIYGCLCFIILFHQHVFIHLGLIRLFPFASVIKDGKTTLWFSLGSPPALDL